MAVANLAPPARFERMGEHPAEYCLIRRGDGQRGWLVTAARDRDYQQIRILLLLALVISGPCRKPIESSGQPSWCGCPS